MSSLIVGRPLLNPVGCHYCGRNVALYYVNFDCEGNEEWCRRCITRYGRRP